MNPVLITGLCFAGLIGGVVSGMIWDYVMHRRVLLAELAKIRPITVWLRPTHPEGQIKHAVILLPGRMMKVPMHFVVQPLDGTTSYKIVTDVEITAFHP